MILGRGRLGKRSLLLNEPSAAVIALKGRASFRCREHSHGQFLKNNEASQLTQMRNARQQEHCLRHRTLHSLFDACCLMPAPQGRSHVGVRAASTQLNLKFSSPHLNNNLLKHWIHWFVPRATKTILGKRPVTQHPEVLACLFLPSPPPAQQEAGTFPPPLPNENPTNSGHAASSYV